VPDDYFCRDPDHRSIYRFIRNLFHSAQLTAECAIVTLVRLSLSLFVSRLSLLYRPIVSSGAIDYQIVRLSS